ncbi:hypothetical protein [Methylobacterium sp. Leaf123]|uniref:hypothetical protein n=1 Tax=Methylobacterium sp. Leaf123 TaxID=1736264 RepID=UPI001910E76B|nr:hypothetical protein [Methylobacterium sp. Leaf123]
MQAFFSSEGSYALQFLVIFLVILVLFLIATLLFMRLSGRGLTLSASAGQRGRQPRLGIVDIYELDRQRQLILLRRDNVEHLLLVGGPNDVVIERHIQRGAGARYAPDGSARPGGEAGIGDPALEPRTDPFLDSPMPPTFAMPEVVPSAVSGAQPAPDRTPPLDPGLFEPEALPADAPARPVSPVSRLMRRTAPPVVPPRPEVASERPARPEPASVDPVPEPVPEPPVMASRGPRSVDPAVLSDMARQLQVALKRPSSAVTPPPAGPAEMPPPASKPAEPAPARPDPIAAAMAAAPVPPVPAAPSPQAPPVQPEPAPVVAPPRPEPKPAAPAKPATPPPFVASPKPDPVKPEPLKTEPPRPEPSRPEPARPEPSKPEPSKAEPPEPAAQAQNPFSVEEIEAEFARLLGRPLDSKN